MKKFLIALLIFISASFVKLNAQSGFSEGYYIQEVCGPRYYTVEYGNAYYAWWQNCRRAVWNSYYGSYNGYFWTCNANGYCYWQTRTEYRTWWYYTWVDYVKRVG